MARIICLFLLSLSLHSAVSEDYNNPLQGVNSPQRAEYVCNINESWLEHLENTLLNKSSHQNVFKHCKSNYEQIKNCCTDPLNCKHKELKHISQNLKEESLTKAKEAQVQNFSTCSLNNLQSLLASLNGTHNQVCNTGIKTCEDVCKDKLITLQNAFRDSFMIPDNISIDEILKKAQAPPVGQIDCYNKMKEMAKKYKDQTLHKKPFRQRLKVGDIIDCDKISLANTRKSLNSFALNVCREAQSQKQIQSANQEESKKQQEIAAQQTKDSKSSLAAAAVVGGGAVLGASTQTKHQQSKPQAQYQYQYQRNQSQNQKIQAKYQQPQAKYQQTQIQPQYQKNPVYPPPYIPSEKEAKAGESFLNRLKSGYSSTLDKIKSIFGGETIVKKVEKLCTDNRPLMHLGQITYQTVKAPQIERLNKEDLRPYNNYELIQGKASGVMVKIRKKLWVRKIVGLHQPKHYKKDISDFLKKQSFRLFLSINGTKYENISCSQLLTEDIVRYKTDPEGDPVEEKLKLTKDHCTLKWSEIKDNEIVYKFIPLPLSIPTKKEKVSGKTSEIANVEILLQPIVNKKEDFGFQSACEETEKMKLNILEPRTFKISLIGIEAPKCKKGSDELAYTSMKGDDLNLFYNSDELLEHIYKMFPIRKDTVTIEMARNNFLGTCTKGYIGIIKDFWTLYDMIEEGSFDRVVYIADKSYRKYHEDKNHSKNWAGLNHSVLPITTLPYIWQLTNLPYIWKFFWSIKPNVSVVLKHRVDRGTVLHELAHSLGQLKEGYESKNHCAQVTDEGILPGKAHPPCLDYRITGGLTTRYNPETRKHDWIFLNNQKSFMNNKRGTIERKLLGRGNLLSRRYNQWIDRETYQKILDTIQTGWIKDDYFNNIKWQAPEGNTLNPQLIQASFGNASCDLKKRPILKIKGIYNKEDGSLTDFSIKTKIGNIENLFDLVNLLLKMQKR